MSEEFDVIQLPDGEELVRVIDPDSRPESTFQLDPREVSLSLRRQMLELSRPGAQR
jgi:hypothetical protein